MVDVFMLWLCGCVNFQLSKKVINMRELRRIASQGIPDGGGIRSTVWKVLFISWVLVETNATDFLWSMLGLNVQFLTNVITVAALTGLFTTRAWDLVIWISQEEVSVQALQGGAFDESCKQYLHLVLVFYL